jgi:hypothetical protein
LGMLRLHKQKKFSHIDAIKKFESVPQARRPSPTLWCIYVVWGSRE